MINLATMDDVPWDADPHTPTPWSEFAESGDWWIQGRDADGSPIGDVVCDANSMRAADMGFIITACNAHDALVGALEAIEAHHVKQNAVKGRDEAHSTTLRLARAALMIVRGDANE